MAALHRIFDLRNWIIVIITLILTTYIDDWLLFNFGINYPSKNFLISILIWTMHMVLFFVVVILIYATVDKIKRFLNRWLFCVR